MYGPTRQRLTAAIEADRLTPGRSVSLMRCDPEVVISGKETEWLMNYKRGEEVMDEYLRHRHGVGYKEVTRSDVPLKVKE